MPWHRSRRRPRPPRSPRPPPVVWHPFVTLCPLWYMCPLCYTDHSRWPLWHIFTCSQCVTCYLSVLIQQAQDFREREINHDYGVPALGRASVRCDATRREATRRNAVPCGAVSYRAMHAVRASMCPRGRSITTDVPHDDVLVVECDEASRARPVASNNYCPRSPQSLRTVPLPPLPDSDCTRR